MKQDKLEDFSIYFTYLYYTIREKGALLRSCNKHHKEAPPLQTPLDEREKIWCTNHKQVIVIISQNLGSNLVRVI